MSALTATQLPVRGDRYHPVAAVLHWTIAACIIFCLIVGTFMEGLHPPGLRGAMVMAHASAGISVLVLTAVRVGWRLSHPPPPLLPGHRWEHMAAHAVHGALYLAMIAMPLIGWSIVSAHPAAPGRVFRIFAAIPLPPIALVQNVAPLARQHQLHDQLVWAHATGGWILLGLLILHVGGAVKHQWLDRQPEFQRMWPSGA